MKHISKMPNEIPKIINFNIFVFPKIIILKFQETQQISGQMSNIHLVLGNSLLTLWGVTSRDAGQYICIAENTAGTDSRRYNVAVMGNTWFFYS